MHEIACITFRSESNEGGVLLKLAKTQGCSDTPAAFLSAVKFLAFTIAFTPPLLSSTTMVLAGNPRSLTSCGAIAVGTATTFMVVPTDATLDGMKRHVWFPEGTVVRGGCTIPGSDLERREKTSAMRATSSSGVNRVVTLDTLEADSILRDIRRAVAEEMEGNEGVQVLLI